MMLTTNQVYPHSTNTATTIRFDTFASYLSFASVSQFFCNVFSRHSAQTICEECFDILKLWKETDMCRDGWDFVWIIDTPGPSWHQKRSIKTPPRLNRTPPPPPLPTRGGPRLGLWDAAEAGRRTSKAPKMPKKLQKIGVNIRWP